MSRLVRFLFSLFFLTSCSSLYSDQSNGNVIPGGSISKKDLKVVDSMSNEKALNIALLVPLNKEKENIGESLVKSAQLAMMYSNRTDVNLVILDSGLLDNSSKVLLDKLTEQKIDVVIGPLYGAATQKMAALIRDRGITVLSLSNDSSIKSDSVLIMGISPDSQAVTMTNYAISRGVEHFHLLLSNDKFGRLVEDAVGNIVANKNNISYTVNWYNSNNSEQIINQVVSSVDNNSTQAIFMPQGGSNLSLLNDSLAEHKLDQVTLMGVQAWDDPKVLGFSSLNGAFVLRKDLAEEQFYDNFSRVFNSAVSNIDFITYNTLIMIVNMHRDQLPLNKQSIIDNNQVSGKYSDVIFNSNGLSFYDLSVAEIRNRSFKPVE